MRPVDVGKLKEVCRQLTDLLEHCRDMANGMGADLIWGKDVEALETVIGVIQAGERRNNRKRELDEQDLGEVETIGGAYEKLCIQVCPRARLMIEVTEEMERDFYECWDIANHTDTLKRLQYLQLAWTGHYLRDICLRDCG